MPEVIIQAHPNLVIGLSAEAQNSFSTQLLRDFNHEAADNGVRMTRVTMEPSETREGRLDFVCELDREPTLLDGVKLAEIDELGFPLRLG